MKVHINTPCTRVCGTKYCNTNLVSEELVKSIVIHMPMYSCVHGLQGTKIKVQRLENCHNTMVSYNKHPCVIHIHLVYIWELIKEIPLVNLHGEKNQ